MNDRRLISIISMVTDVQVPGSKADAITPRHPVGVRSSTERDRDGTTRWELGFSPPSLLLSV